MVNLVNHKRKLRYHGGNFILENARTIPGNAWTRWVRPGDDGRKVNFTTRDLKAAAAFRSSSDSSASRIFKRAFQERYELPRLPPLPRLDAHQREGLEWILTRKRSYLAHAPGAGKTAQAVLAACLAGREGQVLFIVPPSLTLNWEREIWNFTQWVDRFPTVGIVPQSDRRESMAWRAEFVICPDSMLTKPWVYERLEKMTKRFIAVDEASRFKEPLAERSLAFYGGRSGERRYGGLFQDARHVVFLDGSPMPNRPIELWAPTFALHPESIDCMDRDDFGYRYCGARPNERGVWEYLYSSNEAELKRKLQNDFMHVVPESRLKHPERLRSMVVMNRDVRSGEQKTWERRHLSNFRIDGISEDRSQGEMARFRAELGLRKVPFIASYVADRLDEKSEQILLFAWHREVCENLARALERFTPGLVIGGTPATQRERFFSEFQAGKRRILVLNIAAGGRGHNLQAADRVLFGEYSWTDEMNRQCEKRASRRGNEKLFTRCEYLVSPDSMDEIVLRSIFTKERRVKRVIG